MRKSSGPKKFKSLNITISTMPSSQLYNILFHYQYIIQKFKISNFKLKFKSQLQNCSHLLSSIVHLIKEINMLYFNPLFFLFKYLKIIVDKWEGDR